MIKWYCDKNLKISFSQIPNVKIRFATINNSKKEIKEINSKPFINLENLDVKLENFKNLKVFNFTIYKSYTWDGASIPRIFWYLIGAKTDSRFLIPSLIHDVLCENHNYIDNDRYFATLVFDSLLKVSRVNPISRKLIFHSVDNFQKFCRW